MQEDSDIRPSIKYGRVINNLIKRIEDLERELSIHRDVLVNTTNYAVCDHCPPETAPVFFPEVKGLVCGEMNGLLTAGQAYCTSCLVSYWPDIFESLDEDEWIQTRQEVAMWLNLYPGNCGPGTTFAHDKDLMELRKKLLP